ncbi:MAG: class I SAM-dependent DNA methyltransferase [Dermatophilaceae bacterium]
MTSSDLWSAETAARYDEGSAAMFAPEVLDPTVARLAEFADGGPVLELAIGTGRVAVALAERGVAVSGIELSEPMAERLRAKRSDVPVVVGDMATARVPRAFSLVYLVFNTLGNLRTQAEQVECFRNAARHLVPGGRFVVEVGVPSLRRLPPGQVAVPFEVSDEHVGFDTYDLVGQQGTSHHYTREADGSYRYGVHHYRFVWPDECDLMARLAGMEPEHRWADWHGAAFTGDSKRHVSVWRTPGSR